MTTRSSHPRAKRAAGVLGVLGLGVLGGFVASLLRRRPPTIYVEGVQSTPGGERGEPGAPPADEDERAAQRDEATGEPVGAGRAGRA